MAGSDRITAEAVFRNWQSPGHDGTIHKQSAFFDRHRMTSTFADLGLGEAVLRAVSDAGYDTPTPIQAKAIPLVLMNRDILGCAQTGTGKTASFTLPMIDVLAEGRARARMPRSVILEPTRELAAQVAQNFETYGKYHKLNMALLIGGVSFSEQEKRLDRGVDVLIATPGRLLDHTERGKVILNDTKILVIDEADRMLDMGFIPDVERIVSLMPTIRQTLMFSATMPKEIKRLAAKFLLNPKEIYVDPPSSAAESVMQKVAFVSARDKRKALRDLLSDQEVSNALVFCNRKRDVATLHRSLAQAGLSVGTLHGDMDQYKRMEWLEKFRTNEVKILVCSDVAARGLDIPTVSHVFNYDVPANAEDYVHRIGRTGRAGRSGTSFTLVTPEESKLWAAVIQLLGKPAEIIDLPGVASTAAPSEDAATEKGETSPGGSRREARGGGRRKSGRARKGGSPRKESAGRRTTPEEETGRAEAQPDAARRNEPRRNETPEKPARADKTERQGGEAEDSDRPFGESDNVPDFLRRGV